MRSDLHRARVRLSLNCSGNCYEFTNCARVRVAERRAPDYNCTFIAVRCAHIHRRARAPCICRAHARDNYIIFVQAPCKTPEPRSCAPTVIEPAPRALQCCKSPFCEACLRDCVCVLCMCICLLDALCSSAACSVQAHNAPIDCVNN